VIRFTITPSVYSPHTLQLQTLPDFAALVGALRAAFSYTEDKTDSDLLIPVAEWSNLYRAAGNIITHSRLFCADLDRMSSEDMLQVAGALEGVSAVLYTTHSHRTERKDYLDCWRAIVELDAEYHAAQFRAVWHGVNQRLAGKLDPATLKHPELAYYAPSAPPGGAHDFIVSEGHPWSTQELAQTPVPAAQIEKRDPGEGLPPPPPILRKDVARWVQRTESEAALAAQNILAGRESVEIGAGKRNGVLISIAGHLANRWPAVDPQGLAELFKGIGWDLFSPDHKYEIEDLAAMIERMQAQTQETRDNQKAQEISVSTAGDRVEPITSEELVELQSVYGEQWPRHLIGLYGRDCYLLRPDGQYRSFPVPKENLIVSLRSDLSVFGDYFDLFYEDEKGRHQKQIGQILQEYSTVINNVVFDWLEDSKPWDPRDRTIYLRPAPRRVQPVGHKDVQDWLDCMPPILTDMLSQMPHHDRILPVLVLTGSKSTGKTMLAQGIARIYAEGAVDGEEAFGDFNASSLKTCPVILVDEKAPKIYFQEGTSLLRRWVTRQHWRLNEKFQHRIIMRGFLRVIMAGNTAKIVSTQEEMDREDREAFGERLVHVDLSPGRQYLRGLGRNYIQKRWLDERALAEHVLFLAQHWEVRNPGERMAVFQPPQDFHAGLMMHSKVASEILYWIVSYLDNPKPGDNAHLAIERKQGELLIHTSAIVKGWSIYLPDQRPFTPGQIGSALSSLSVGLGKRRLIKTAGGGSVKAHVLDNQQLRQALDRHGSSIQLEDILQ
jgi:hypothetical protein